jgi:hypothetical protein
MRAAGVTFIADRGDVCCQFFHRDDHDRQTMLVVPNIEEGGPLAPALSRLDAGFGIYSGRSGSGKTVRYNVGKKDSHRALSRHAGRVRPDHC